MRDGILGPLVKDTIAMPLEALWVSLRCLMDPGYPVVVHRHLPIDDVCQWIVLAVEQFDKHRQHYVSPEISAIAQTDLATE